MPHDLYTLLTASLVAVSIAAVGNRTAGERARAGARAFALCLSAVIGGGWLMRLLHG
ncbi:MAG TPA: hypothetical protein VMU19_03995 [Bryobacteraceae bacterium]|nr:hypothetical protein [Bryobacteraceae bacterium]